MRDAGSVVVREWQDAVGRPDCGCALEDDAKKEAPLDEASAAGEGDNVSWA